VTSLLSDYQFLDADWRLTEERNSLVLAGGWHRDSTFYNVVENYALQGTTLHRQEETGNATWQHLLSERSDFEIIGSYDQIAYAHNPSILLANYSYLQGTLQYDRTLSERWQWTLAAGDGHYHLGNDSYNSDNRFVQTSLTHALSQLWSMSAQLGYSRISSITRAQQLAIFEVPGGGFEIGVETFSVRAAQGTESFAASLERKGERLVLDVAASRAIQPSGFGALLTQDDASITATLPWTERWTLGARVHGSRLSDPLLQIAIGDRRFYDADLNATWLVTEHWTLQLAATYLFERASSYFPTVSSTSISLSLSRQLGHLRL
jgi:hypothetical protein